MGPYISKADIVSEIRKRLLPVIRDKHYDEFEEGQDSERIAILNIIDTLETKEADSEKELIEEIYSHIDSIKDTADRMTIGNFMHQVLDYLIGLKKSEGMYKN